MKIPDHSHEYLIPIATQEEIREGTSQDSVVVPKILGTASLYSYETFAPLEQVVNARQESEKSMARANSAQQVAEESKRVSDQALTEVTKTGEAVTAATTTANLAKDTADTAKGLAEESKSASDAAKQMAEEAKALSEQSKNACAEVKASVATVKIVAESAQTGVEQASQTASEAKGLAESAKSAAESVTEKVDQALREASDAKSKAEGLETIANEAKSTSDQASQTALSAKSLSEEAKEVAETAKSTAEEAKSVAEQAKEEADTTKQGLGEVKSSLDTVTATTNSANTAASEAKVLAEEAKSALTEVQEKAQRNSDSLSELQSKVGSLSTNFLENVRFNQPNRILEDDPENRKGLVINNGACFRFYHGGENGGRYLFYRVPGRGRMTFDKDLEAGKDYYIYLIPTLTNNNEISFEISQNPTAPDGYTEDTSKKIGGFHTLCADVGEIEDHPLSGYQAGDILPDSVWCLNHRPRSDPEGMVYDPWKNIWVDIYLQSGTDENTKSAYGVPITTNRSYSDHHVDFSSVNKRFLTSDEFASCMCGINSGTSIIGNKAPSPKTSGGHVDTENRRMISYIGCEDGCGYVWQFLSGCYPVTKWHTGEKGSSLRVDVNVMLGGGDWSGDASNGEFARNFAHSRYVEDEKIGARGCSDPFYYN
ncbi:MULTISPECIES: alanine-zipper protein [unclassified Bartonella]|uniref:phage major tropism determinant n=1 Tax=unclassified Bartonella TaxID=2645622 RepID=UPI0035D0FB70